METKIQQKKINFKEKKIGGFGHFIQGLSHCASSHGNYKASWYGKKEGRTLWLKIKMTSWVVGLLSSLYKNPLPTTALWKLCNVSKGHIQFHPNVFFKQDQSRFWMKFDWLWTRCFVCWMVEVSVSMRLYGLAAQTQCPVLSSVMWETTWGREFHHGVSCYFLWSSTMGYIRYTNKLKLL